jgi:hypothetical protein
MESIEIKQLINKLVVFVRKLYKMYLANLIFNPNFFWQLAVKEKNLRFLIQTIRIIQTLEVCFYFCLRAVKLRGFAANLDDIFHSPVF